MIYPLENFYYIDKLRDLKGLYNINISCCQRVSQREQHFKIIDEIHQIQNQIRNVTLTFQLSYKTNDPNENEYIGKLINYIENNIHDIEYKIYTEYFDFDDLAKYRLENKIFINMKLVDQFSGAMAEALYAGAYIIAGTWLPYDELIEKGIFYKSIDKFNDLGNAILEAINYLRNTDQIELKNNIEIMKSNYHPNVSLENYFQFYTKLLK